MAESMPLDKSMKRGSDILPDIYCDPCYDVEGKILQAVRFCKNCSENLCPDCITAHKKQKISRNHQLIDKKGPPQKKASNNGTKSVTAKCSLHDGELLRSYCRSCDQLCCEICQTVDHQACKMQSLTKAAANIKDSQQLKDLEKKLIVLKEQYNKNLSKATKQSFNIEKFYTDAIKDTRNLQKKFEKLLAETEKNAETVKDEDSKNMESISKTCNVIVEQINKISCNVDQMQDNSDNVTVFISIKRVESQLKSFEDRLFKLETDNTIQQYTFEPETKLNAMLDELKMLGKLSFYNSTSSAPISQDISSASMTKTSTSSASMPKISTSSALMPKMSTNSASMPKKSQSSSSMLKISTSSASMPKTSKNSASMPKTSQSSSSMLKISTSSASMPKTSQSSSSMLKISTNSAPMLKTPVFINDIDCESIIPSGSLMLPNQRLLFSANIETVKLIDTKQSRIVSKLQLPYDIWVATQIKEDEVAMTCHSEKKIQFVSVSSDKLSKGREMSVGGACRGIEYNDQDDTLIVSYDSPPKVEIMSLTGTVIKIFDKDANGAPLFSYPWYMSLSHDKTMIYVTDTAHDSVTLMTLTGEIKAVYKDKTLQEPRGVCVNRFGIVYVVGYGSHTVHQIVPDSDKLEPLLDQINGLSMPRTITYCDVEDKLYVGQQTDTGLKIFKMK